MGQHESTPGPWHLTNSWADQATRPSYDRLRGAEGSPRWIACRGLSDEQIRERDRNAQPPHFGRWLDTRNS